MFYRKKMMILWTMYKAAQHHIMAHTQSLLPFFLSGPFPFSKTYQGIAPKMILSSNLQRDLYVASLNLSHTRGSWSGDKVVRAGSWHLPSAKVKNEWNYTTIPPTCLHGKGTLPSTPLLPNQLVQLQPHHQCSRTCLVSISKLHLYFMWLYFLLPHASCKQTAFSFYKGSMSPVFLELSNSCSQLNKISHGSVVLY